MTPAAAKIVALVARREFDARVRTRSFVIGLLVTMLLLAGILVGPMLLGDDGEQPVAFVGGTGLAGQVRATAGQAGLELTTVELPDEAAARDQVRAGELDAAVVATSRVIVESSLEPALRAVLETSVRQQTLSAALAEQGVDPASVAAAGAPLRVEALDPPQPGADERLGIAVVVVILLYFQLITFGIAVAMGVVEEKTSRVVEVLLSTIRPWQLLLGKVLGIGAAGLLNLVVLGAVGLTVGTATGMITLTGTAVSVFAASLGWFLLGFLFFAVLYAAAGSLVSRQEEINAVTTPMTVLILIPFVIAFNSLQDPGGGLAATLAWVPPFSPILMPIQQATGNSGIALTVLAVVLMLAATAMFTWIGGRIYANAVLRTGSRVKLGEALRAGT
ncbi:MAG: ABC transporter permease subunit [Pseudonocardiaceae bacterium]|nr:ABC transporter permease subunit [Pseudonocardiaceae bacterium]